MTSRFDRLVHVVVDNSGANNFKEACAEWDITGVVDLAEHPELIDELGTCVCGYSPIRWAYRIRNRLNAAEIEPVGNVCIHHFESEDLKRQANLLHRIAHIKELSARLGSEVQLPLRRWEPCWSKDASVTSAVARGLWRIGLLDPVDDLDAMAPDLDDALGLLTAATGRKEPGNEALRYAHAVVEHRLRPNLALWDGSIG